MNAKIKEVKIVHVKYFWIYIIAAVASLGGMLSGFDMGVVSGALLYINESWQMSSFEQGWIVSAAIVGAVLGAAMNGSLSDIYGRKKLSLQQALFLPPVPLCALFPHRRTG